VVVGGSLAGMLATRVLSDHFDSVTLLERDSFPETPAARKPGLFIPLWLLAQLTRKGRKWQFGQD
jgi:hypothetical protein